jgi:replicative DNA helicase
MHCDPLNAPDLERNTLAALLADNRNFDRLGQLEPDDLSDPMHAAMLAAMLDIRAEGRAVNLVTLRSRFVSTPFGDEGTVLDYLKSCEFAGQPPDVADLAATLRELSIRRKLAQAGDRIAGSVHDHAAAADVLLEDAAREIDDLQTQCRRAGKTRWEMPEAVEALLAANDDRDKCIPTGLSDLDRMMSGGARMGELIIVGGRPSMGKSTFDLALVRRAARAGYGVLLFSLEMSAHDCMLRMATDAGWSHDNPVSYSAARAGKLNDRQRHAFEQGGRSLTELLILIEERSGLTLSDIGAGTRRAAEYFDRRCKRLGMVVIDHLGFMRPTNRYKGNKVHEVAEITAGLQRLAKSEQIVVLGVQQLNRAVEGRDNKRPTLVDLRDSGSIEQDADVVMFAYRSAYYLERTKGADDAAEAKRVSKLQASRNDLEIIIAKQRHGPTGTIELFCDMAASAIRDKWRGE